MFVSVQQGGQGRIAVPKRLSVPVIHVNEGDVLRKMEVSSVSVPRTTPAKPVIKVQICTFLGVFHEIHFSMHFFSIMYHVRSNTLMKPKSLKSPVQIPYRRSFVS